jgi:phosphodiesterase/alkaline phosphatase D-like protein
MFAWKHLYRSSLLLTLVSARILAGASGAQRSPYVARDIPPPARKAARAQITEGPALEIFRNNEAIIHWTCDNPGGTDEHYGLVQYGTDPDHLTLAAKSHIRLNRNHPYTVFRVRVEGLQPGTTYFYTVHSVEANGTDDGVKSGVYRLTTPSGA